MSVPARLAPLLERIGLVLALAAAVFKATTTISTFPGWDFDPFTFPSPTIGIGPAGAMAGDALIAVGVTMLLIGRRLSGASLPLASMILFTLGGVGILLHVWPPARHTVADMWIGSSWLTAMLLGVGACAATSGANGARTRGLIAAVIVGFVALLAVRGVQQVLIEHPATLAEFERNKDSIFAAQGWSPDSTMARAFERRIKQPEATGWFGLANVYATFAAVGVVMGAALFVGALRALKEGESRPAPALLVVSAVALAAGVAALILAGGKGGYLAALLGLCVLAILWMPKLRGNHGVRVGGALAIGSLGATMLLVVARGILAERISELSLLFRWFYAQAAVRIGFEHLPLGVGPDGFQRAYMIAKNPLSPEDVTSSHNMLLDWFATLGVFGVAWIALWMLWLWRAGAGAAATPPDAEPLVNAPPDDSARRDRWALAGVGTLATLAALRVDQGVLTLDVAAMRLIGLIAFCAVGWATLALARLDARVVRAGMAAAAIAGASHALIDVTGVWPSSAALLFSLVGAGGAARLVPRVPRARRDLVALGVVALVAAAGVAQQRVYAWEQWLRSSAARAAEVGTHTQRWQNAMDGLRARRPGAVEEAQSLAADLSRLNGGIRVTNPEEMAAALREWDCAMTHECATRLADLAALMPREWRVRREASRVTLREAALLEAMNKPQEAAAARAEAERVASSSPPGVPPTAAELAWVSMVRESLAQGSETQRWLLGAAGALEEAAKLAPYDLEYARRLMSLYDRAGDAQRARRWAARALQLDAQAKYDREVKGMSQRDREEAMRLSTGS